MTTPAETTAATPQEKPTNDTCPPPGKACQQQIFLGLLIGLGGLGALFDWRLLSSLQCLCYWVKRMAKSR